MARVRRWTLVVLGAAVVSGVSCGGGGTTTPGGDDGRSPPGEPGRGGGGEPATPPGATGGTPSADGGVPGGGGADGGGDGDMGAVPPGCAPQAATVELAVNETFPNHVRVDAGGAYWTSVVSGSGVNDPPGLAIRVLGPGAATPRTLATMEHAFAWDIATDDTHIYLGWERNVSPMNSGIAAVSKADGTVRTLVTALGVRGIAVDATHVYWVEAAGTFGDVEQKARLLKVAKAGGLSTELRVAPRTLRPFSAVDETAVYVAEMVNASFDTQLLAIDKHGGAVTVLGYQSGADSSGFSADAFALDAHTVYYAVRDPGLGASVYAIAKTGGPRRLLGRQGDFAVGLAVDESSVYLASQTWWPSDALSQISVMPKAGGPVTKLADAVMPSTFALDASAVYWTGRSSSVFRHCK